MAQENGIFQLKLFCFQNGIYSRIKMLMFTFNIRNVAAAIMNILQLFEMRQTVFILRSNSD